MTRHIKPISTVILAFLAEGLLGCMQAEEEDVVPKSEEVRK